MTLAGIPHTAPVERIHIKNVAASVRVISPILDTTVLGVGVKWKSESSPRFFFF